MLRTETRATFMSRATSLLAGCLVLAVLLAAGCTPAPTSVGDEALKRGDYAAAKAAYEEQLQKNPDNVRVKAALGRAQYNLNEYDAAIATLEPIHRDNPGNATAALYLGLSHEAKGNIPGAESAYERYLTTDSKSDMARHLRGRLIYLRDNTIRAQAKEAVKLESSMKLDTTGPMVVAVLPFAVSGPGSDSLEALGKGMAAAISYDLFQVKSIKVVERLRLNSIFEELALADSGITDPNSSPRVGRLVGANQLVNSGLKFLPNHDVSIQSGVIRTRDAAYRPALLTENQFERLWQVQKDITFAVIDQLGILLTPEERNAIQKIPTRNVEAFMAYSRGIEAMDRGDYETAHMQFQQAAKLDPGFEQAKAMQSESGAALEGSAPAAQFESTLAAGLPGTGTGTGLAGPSPMEIINGVARPSTDPRTDDPAGGGGGTGTANVGGSIP